MRILIIENEIYLAQSISAKLNEQGHTCDISSSTQDAFTDTIYDIVLLSTGISGQDIYPVIEAYKDSVVILMVSYVSNDTVTRPLSAGAKDYILKPFMIEELIRKMEHYQRYNSLLIANKTHEQYIKHQFRDIKTEQDVTSYKTPLFISCNYQKYSDLFAFEYAASKKTPLSFISLESSNALAQLKNISAKELVCVTDYQVLKKSDRKTLLDIIKNKNAIVTSTESILIDDFETIVIKSNSPFFEHGEILSIEDYVKYIVLNYQGKFPDTELSKKLGISRKNLWEKRKKFGITKNK